MHAGAVAWLARQGREEQGSMFCYPRAAAWPTIIRATVAYRRPIQFSKMHRCTHGDCGHVMLTPPCTLLCVVSLSKIEHHLPACLRTYLCLCSAFADGGGAARDKTQFNADARGRQGPNLKLLRCWGSRGVGGGWGCRLGWGWVGRRGGISGMHACRLPRGSDE